MNGVTEPMTTLPHLHALLDVVESVLMEQTFKDSDRDRLLDQLYRPEITVKKTDPGWKPPPGFDPDSMEDAFEAAASQGL